MKFSPRLILPLFIAFGPLAFADELVKQVQTELKDQGFFYGEVTGVNGPDTVAALKRFQIRNGLEVTGTMTPEILKALELGGNDSPPALETPKPKVAQKPRAVPPPPVPDRAAPRTDERSKGPVNLRKDGAVEERDRYFLEREEARQDRPPAGIEDDRDDRAPSRRDAGSDPTFADIYLRTPYATAPVEVQQDVLRKAQRALAGGGFYNLPIDGLPGPATEDAILGYQRLVRLPLSGRLDLETLNAMRLLPGRGDGPPMQPGTRRSQQRQQQPPPSSQRSYRGIWID